MAFYFLVILGCFALFLLLIPLATFFHEMGHAIVALYYLKDKVIVNIGKTKPPIKAITLNIGRFTINMSLKPLTWNRGSCKCSYYKLPIYQQIVVIVMGPIISLIIAVIGIIIIFHFDMHGFIKLLTIIFTALAGFDLFINLTPRSQNFIPTDQGYIYNDGLILKYLNDLKPHEKLYLTALDNFGKKEFKKTAQSFEILIDEGIIYLHPYIVLSCYYHDKCYKEAKTFLEKFELIESLDLNCLIIKGLILIKLEEYDAAILVHDKTLSLDPENKTALHNKGYSLLCTEKYQESITCFDRVIEEDDKFAFAYNNRGLARLKTNQIEEGLSDIKYSLELNDKNSYAYRNLGIYYLEMKNYNEALTQFEKAKEMDNETSLIDELISEATAQSNKDSIH